MMEPLENIFRSKAINQFYQDSGLEYKLCEEIFGVFIGAVKSVVEAIEKANELNDFEKSRGLIHGLKGNAGNVRATDIADVALKVELAIKDNDMVLAKSEMKILKKVIEKYM